MKEFKDYLTQKGYNKQYVERTNNTIKAFQEWSNTNKIDHKTADYNALMLYVEHQRQKGNKTNTLKQKVKAISNYYAFILRADNPATQIKLKGQLHKIPHQLLEESELLEIFKLQHTKGLIGKRDKVVVSLIIFQGLIANDLEAIELKDVDLLEGKIYVPSTRTTNARTLDLKPQQLLLFQDYISKIRREILKEANTQSNKLIVTTGISKTNEERLQNLVNIIRNRIKVEFPKLKSLKQIRQSVITNWLNQYGLRQTQYMAGHRFVSSTERYNVEKEEGLRLELDKHFPI